MNWIYKIDNELRYDFYLIDNNIILEVDGGQHFEFSQYLHENEDNFIEARQRDIIKYQQCKNHKIKMIRLDYKWIPTYSNDEIYNFIIEATESKEKLILSTPEIYDWIYEKLSNEKYEKYNVKPPSKIKIIIKNKNI